MDNITHALAGSLLAAAACRHVDRSVDRPDEPPARAMVPAAWTLGLVLAELPDIDIFYSGESLGMGKLGYLLHHRGHTHTLVFGIAAALVAWGVVLFLSRTLRAPRYSRPLLVLSLVASLSHVVLDFTNSYGVHPWWPLSGRWFYGDAVFIVEPWFWIVTIPPLLFVLRSTVGRLLLAALLAIILVASWRVEMVGTGVAAVVTAGAAVWSAVSWRTPAARRVTLGIVGWLVLESLFFAASAAGRSSVQRAVGPELRDVILSPSPGNPLCLSAIVVTEEAGVYAATRATVAPVPVVHSGADCRQARGADTARPRLDRRTDTPAISWGWRWQAPVTELQALAAERCDLRAALHFIRVPIWRRAPTGEVTMFDLRYGEGEDSFTTIVSRPGVTCGWTVPAWEPPRRDLLEQVID